MSLLFATLAVASTMQGPASLNVTSAVIGQPIPAFSLPAADGKTYNMKDLQGKHVVLEWTNRDCPVVARHYGSGNMQATQAKAKEMGAVWLSVCSSAPGKQGNLTVDEFNANLKETKSAAKTVLFDFDGKIGKAFNAKTTPQIVIVDPKGVLIYNGAIDDKPNGGPGATNYAIAALTESMAGKPVSVTTSRPYGCGIKY